MRTIERACYLIGAVLIVAGIFHLGVFVVDGGPWEGPVSWRKPATFGLSFGLTLMTITWVTSYLKPRPILLAVFALDCIAEVFGITLQAWRKVPSHFNMQTPFDTSISMMLAFGGFVLIVILVTFAIQAFRGAVGVSPSMRLALRAGFATLMVGLASGAAMIARGVTLTNTGHQREAFDTAGFLKLVHGISLHGVLVLPAIAWLLAKTSIDESRRVRYVALAATAYGLAILAALIYSLARTF